MRRGLSKLLRPRFLVLWVRILRRLTGWQRVVGAVGLLATLVGVLLAHEAPGVYQGQVFVVLLPPQQTEANAFYSSRSLVITAGLVEKMINGSTLHPQPASDGVPLSSQGIYHGWSVRLPNGGNQWVSIYKRAELNVQATGDSPEEVQATLDVVIARIQTALRDRQVQDGTAPVNMIRTELSPPQPVIEYDHGSRSRASLAALLLGLGLTAAAMVRVGKMQRRWGGGWLPRAGAGAARRSSTGRRDTTADADPPGGPAGPAPPTDERHGSLV